MTSPINNDTLHSSNTVHQNAPYEHNDPPSCRYTFYSTGAYLLARVSLSFMPWPWKPLPLYATRVSACAFTVCALWCLRDLNKLTKNNEAHIKELQRLREEREALQEQEEINERKLRHEELMKKVDKFIEKKT